MQNNCIPNQVWAICVDSASCCTRQHTWVVHAKYDWPASNAILGYECLLPFKLTLNGSRVWWERSISITSGFCWRFRQGARLEQKRSKCQWFHYETELCSYYIDQKGVHRLNSTKDWVTKWSPPRNKKILTGFIGLMGNYCNYIWHNVQIALLIYCMCRMRTKVKISGHHSEPQLWDIGTMQFGCNEEAQEAFETLKDVICKAFMMALPEAGGKYMLHSDVS